MDYHYSDNYAKRKNGKRRQPRFATPEPAPPVTMHDHAEYVPAETNRNEYLKLAGVLLVIAIAATMISGLQDFDWHDWLRWFMASFFVIFGSLKLIGYEMFVLMFPGYNPIARRFKLYAYLYPFIELFLALLYISNGLPAVRDLLTLAITGVGAWGVSQAIARSDNSIRCACLGNIIKLPLSTVSLMEDLGMAVMALVMFLSRFFL